MICQDCHKNKATVHVTHVINNQKVILNLCDECAARRGFNNPLKSVPFPLADFLSSMVSKTLSTSAEKLAEKTCPVCKLSYDTFAKTGKLGCGNCFSAFREPLADLLRKIHGSNLHRGKRHTGGASGIEPLKEEARLKDELKQAVSTEDFERAAQLRDMIKDLQKKLEVSDV
ncbi:MAG: UvrB/UvrC motif-containing protein [candidate division Zixibacteria bacterium]|nr:UvrB/UvrC motif-containing protein [candidate division Zixibacteria bacterium]